MDLLKHNNYNNYIILWADQRCHTMEIGMFFYLQFICVSGKINASMAYVSIWICLIHALLHSMPLGIILYIRKVSPHFVTITTYNKLVI